MEQFKSGHAVPVQHQTPPGLEKDLDPKPHHAQLPKEDGGLQTYKAAGKLAGKHALITGGDSGIGRAIACLFAMEGADLCIAYLPQEEEDAQETKRQVEKHGRKCFLHPTDLKDWQNCKQVIEKSREHLGDIDIVVNNHGTQMQVKDIQELSEEQWLNTFDVNIHPFFYLCKYALAHMSSGATIINHASINAYIGRPDLLDYTATKGAVVAFTRALAKQYVTRGVRVNAVATGATWTPLIPSTMDADAIKNFTTPMGRPLQPSEIATCFVFLASTDSSAITGQTIHPNGGVVVNG